MSNNKKILIVTDDLSSKGGGAAIITNIHAWGLLKMGYDVSILTTVDNKDFVSDFVEDNIRTIRVYSKYNSRYRSYLSLYNPFIIKRIKEIFEKGKFDIIHFHNIHYHISYYSVSLARKYSKSVFITIHDSMPFNNGKLFPDSVKMNNSDVVSYKISMLKQIKDFKFRFNPIKNIVIRFFLKKPNKIFAVSEALKNALNDNNINNVEVINNGIDIDKWVIDNEEAHKFINRFNLLNKKVIFFGGRLSGAKGGEIVLDIFSELIDEYKDLYLLIVGEKDKYADKMLDRAFKMGIDKNIVFTGWLDNKLIKYAYNACFLTLVPSLCFDWFPTSVLESMICYKPVIATCFGGSKEIIENGKNGFILDPRNKDDFKEKVKFLLDNEFTLNKFSTDSHERIVSAFTIDKYIKNLDKWYCDTLNK